MGGGILTVTRVTDDQDGSGVQIARGQGLLVVALISHGGVHDCGASVPEGGVVAEAGLEVVVVEVEELLLPVRHVEESAVVDGLEVVAIGGHHASPSGDVLLVLGVVGGRRVVGYDHQGIVGSDAWDVGGEDGAIDALFDHEQQLDCEFADEGVGVADTAVEGLGKGVGCHDLRAGGRGDGVLGGLDRHRAGGLGSRLDRGRHGDSGLIR